MQRKKHSDCSSCVPAMKCLSIYVSTKRRRSFNSFQIVMILFFKNEKQHLAFINCSKALILIETIDIESIGRKISVLPIKFADASKLVKSLSTVYSARLQSSKNKKRKSKKPHLDIDCGFCASSISTKSKLVQLKTKTPIEFSQPVMELAMKRV